MLKKYRELSLSLLKILRLLNYFAYSIGDVEENIYKILKELLLATQFFLSVNL